MKKIFIPVLIFSLFVNGVFAKNTVKMGRMSLNGTTATFPNATVDGSDTVFAISANVDKGSIKTDSITGGHLYTDLEKHQTAIWSFVSGITAAQAQEKVRALVLNYEEGMTLDLEVDSNITNLPDGATLTEHTLPIAKDSNGNDITGSGGTPHYYMFVAQSGITADAAYAAAKSYTFMGMQGYLATITSAAEDKVLDDITKKSGWGGAARIRNSTLDGDTVTEIKFAGTAAETTWSWICGPEAGYGIPIDTTVATKTAQKEANTLYSGFKNEEPNGTGADGECRFQIHYIKSGNDYTQWNDLPASYTSIQGYFVEFSDYKYIAGGGHEKSAGFSLKVNQVYDATNDQDYSSIAQAVANAPTGATIKLLSDQTVENQDVAGKTFIIDTNGKTLTGSFAVSDGSLTITGPAQGATGGVNLDSVSVTGGTCTVNGLVTINSLSLASGKVLTLGSDLNSNSTITLSENPQTGVITSGFGSRNLGQTINLPAAEKNYILLKTKSGELKVTQHKSGL